MKKLILHIPHSATDIPMKEEFVISEAEIEKEILKLTDWYTDDLFRSPESAEIVFGYSRIFCDPERFSDDSQEPMAKVGWGVLYEKTDDNQIMRVISSDLREKILGQYYFPHHTNLNNAVNQQLRLYNRAIILDCHSFPDIPFNKCTNTTIPRPDFNIGSDSFHTSRKLIDISIDFFEQKDFTLGINYPYEGSIVPMEHYQKDRRVQSIMLEVNRKLYLKNGTNEKSANFGKTKKVVQEYIQLLQNEL